MVASQKKTKKQETVHLKKKKLQDRGGVKKGTKGNGGWTDLQREKIETKLNYIVLK